MYDLVMEENETGIIPAALQRAIDLRDISPAQLARDSGVSKGTISLILAGERPNTPARIVAKLAVALDVSVDYLVGITQDPEPRSLNIGDLLLELTRVARKLPSRRQRDLLLLAHSFLEDSEASRVDPAALMGQLLELIQEVGGEASADDLLVFLGRNFDDPDGGFLLDEPHEPPGS